MPSVIISSSNIDTFSFDVSFDIANRTIIFDTSKSVYSGSSGSGIFNVQGIGFSIVDQQGVSLIDIDFSQIVTYVNPVYVLDISYLNFAFLFQNYKIYGSIKDQDGTIYSTAVVYKTVCQPPNINESGYVDGLFQITPDCLNNNLTVKELTLLTYNNTTPLSVSKSGNLYYPTGTIAAVSFASTPFSNNQVYTGQYRIVCTTVGTYDLGDGVYVLVTYLTSAAFDVTCSNSMADILCCLMDTYSVYQKNCNNAIGQSAFNKYNSVMPLLAIGLVQQGAGHDASDTATQIKKLLNCNCGATSIKQNEPTPVNQSVYNIVLQGTGGTTIPAPILTGNTKTYSIQSNVFQISKGDTGDLSYTITPDTSVSNLTKYKIKFNKNIEASYILNAIENDSSLLSQINSLITFSGSNIDLSGVNGSCVIDMSATNYFLSVKVPSGATVIKSVLIGSTTYTAPGGLIVSNPNAIEVWINSLSLGTYSVSYTSGTSGNYSNILSTANAFNPINAIFTISGDDNTVPFGKTNKSITAVLQAIIDYLCNLSALRVALGNNLTLYQFDYNGNIVSFGYSSVTKQSDYNTGIANSIYNIIQRINTLTGITCDKLKAVFIDRLSTNFISSDRFYGTLNGNCAGITNEQAAMAVINAINSSASVKAAYCLINCAVPASCPDVSGLNLAYSGTNIAVYGLTWATTPQASQTVTLKYRLSGNINWVTVSNNILILPNGNISGGSPYIISTAPDTTYDVMMINNCGGAGFISQFTTSSGAVYSGQFLLDNVLYNICGNSPVTLYSSQPFGTGTVMYSDIGLTTPVMGYSYITANAAGYIYYLSTSTGLVGGAIGSSCFNSISGSYKLGNTEGEVCAASYQTLYSAYNFATGVVLYFDAALTLNVSGYSFVIFDDSTVYPAIYNISSSTGSVGASTGDDCSLA